MPVSFCTRESTDCSCLRSRVTTLEALVPVKWVGPTSWKLRVQPVGPVNCSMTFWVPDSEAGAEAFKR